MNSVARRIPTNPDEVPLVVANLPTRISDIVTPWATSTPERPALIESTGTWTYGQMSAAISETRAQLVTLGVRPGDRVMLVCENCRAYIALLLALGSMDAWPVLVNARLSAREVDLIREHSGARRVFYTTTVSPHAREHAKRNEAEIRELAPIGQIAVSALHENTTPEPVESDAAANIAALIYTSGTTGVPKGVMLTHRNLLYVASVSAAVRQVTPEDRVFGVLPMSHAVGLSVVMMGTLLNGGTLYLAPRFDPAGVLSLCERDGLTIIMGVPAMFALLAEYTKAKGIERLRFPKLRVISSSGAPLEASLKTTVERLFDMPLYNGYGMTECAPNIAQARPNEPRKDTAVGRPFPGMEFKFLDPNGVPVPEGRIGELRIRGPNVMRGYYKAPEETAAAIDKDGWFNTRDLARLEDGFLFIEGRAKEMIVRFGFNVYPAELEAVFNAHPAIARSAVIGRTVEGSTGGEEVIAFVQMAADSRVTIADLMDYASEQLVPYKRPTQIIAVPEIPLTPTGKAKKDELAKML